MADARTTLMAAVLALFVAGPASAQWPPGNCWPHSNLPFLPNGVNELRFVMGEACNGAANDAQVWLPWGNDVPTGNYVKYHPYMNLAVGAAFLNTATGWYSRAAWGYDCRKKRNGTDWSVHAWGAAIDVNSVANPLGSSNWNGIGGDGCDHGVSLPYTWVTCGHFVWGLAWDDPMHFQYVKNY